jgi:hypothetical protein
VISDPSVDGKNVLIVNVTDATKHHDDSCILTSGDHEWLTKDSCVAYQFAKVTSIAELQRAQTLGLLHPKRPVSHELLERILMGAYVSDELKGAHRELLRSQSLID